MYVSLVRGLINIEKKFLVPETMIHHLKVHGPSMVAHAYNPSTLGG